MKVVVGGAAGYDDVPGLDGVADRHEILFAPDDAALAVHLPAAEVFVSWSFRGSGLQQQWSSARNLRWVHWCGAGVRPALFPELVASNVVLTNARGIFDRAMAEYVLGMIFAFGLGLPDTLQEQAAHRWTYRRSELVAGSRAVVFGVGGVGRCIGELLAAVGVTVRGVGRTARATSGVFGYVHGRADRLALLAEADWVIAAMPDTTETEGYFGAEEFAAMRPSARFLNVGRGSCVDEDDLLVALTTGGIAGAALDVFREEPLPAGNALWSAPGVIVTPHVSGDHHGFERAVAEQFVQNLERYAAGAQLINVVDKHAGYVRTDQHLEARRLYRRPS